MTAAPKQIPPPVRRPHPQLPERGPGRRHLEPVELVSFVFEALVHAGWVQVGIFDVEHVLDAADGLLFALQIDRHPPAVLADVLLVPCAEPGEFPGDSACGQVVTVGVDAAGRLTRTCEFGHVQEPLSEPGSATPAS